MLCEKLSNCIKEYAADNDIETFSYSGKCMYGKECLAVQTEDPALTLSELYAHILSEEIAEPWQVKDRVLSGRKQDSLGLNYVLYWPNIPA